MTNCPKVLITGYEAAPFYKRGGLGDVMGSLPIALSKQEVDIRAVIPYYSEIQKIYNEKKIGEFAVVFGSKLEKISVHEGLFPKSKTIIYFLANKKYLSKISTKGGNRAIDQFAFFSLAVYEFTFFISEKKKWFPDLIHCNDWHTALTPLVIRGEIPTLLTIHNLNYQGWGSSQVLDLLHVREKEAKEIKKGIPATAINLLGEGILHATRVSTVSSTYAKEISKLYDHDQIRLFLRRRREEKGKEGQVVGILNGIDYNLWNPKTDSLISTHFNINNWEKGKRKNKEKLLESLSLKDQPTFCFIGRMAWQKGLDLLVAAIEKIATKNINIIILGSGNASIEKMLLKTQRKYPFQIRLELTYNEQFSHELYSGSDFIVIPSRYEPCGLIQMIAMRYGTLPIASKTGGLIDSIEESKNGFLFKTGSITGLADGINKALSVYNNNAFYKKMVENAMSTDFSWKKSAILYKKLYNDIINHGI